MEFIQKALNFNTIRKKILFYFLLIIALMSSICVYTIILSKTFMNKIDRMFTDNVALRSLSVNLELTNNNLYGFINTKNSDDLSGYMKYSNELSNAALLLGNKRTFDNNKLTNKNLYYMVENYLIEAEKSISAKRGRNTAEYIELYNNALLIKSYIQETMDTMNLQQFHKNTEEYINLNKKLNTLIMFNLLMIIDTFLIAVLFSYGTTDKITYPIIQLSHQAEEISKGNFEEEAIIVASEDEINVMIEAFNRMKESIKNYIIELQNRAEMESQLKDAEMEKLTIQNLLDKAKLQALQAQINPHFLFNTINAGVQLAMLEGADKTSSFLESMSSIFRYNIKKLDVAVTLREEILNIKAYADLLKVRFGEMIKFEFILDDSLLDITMPPLILQPFVENATIHGLGGSEKGGTIKIIVKREDHNFANIIIEDNGIGMSQEQINKVLDRSIENYNLGTAKKGHTTGIGVRNVIHRLRIYFEMEDIILIESEMLLGTKITLHLPIITANEVHYV